MVNKVIQLFIFGLVPWICLLPELHAQQGQNDNVLDVLNTTTVPAFMIMGVSNTEISRPANIREFTASLQNATSGLTTLPVNYAVEFLVVKEQDITSQTSGPIGQNLSLSFGYTQDPMVVAENSSRAGFGFKFVIKKNTVLPEDVPEIKQALDFSNELNIKLNEARVEIQVQYDRMSLMESNPENVKANNEKQFALQENYLQMKAIQKANRGLVDVIKNGFFMDLAGGLVWDVPGNTIGDTYFSKGGLWLTGGLDNKKGLSIMSVIRGLHEPKMMYINGADEIQYQQVNSFDVGGKLAIRAFKNKLDAGAEFVYRIREANELENTNKVLLNIAYKLGTDDKLSFSFG